MWNIVFILHVCTYMQFTDSLNIAPKVSIQHGLLFETELHTKKTCFLFILLRRSTQNTRYNFSSDFFLLLSFFFFLFFNHQKFQNIVAHKCIFGVKSINICIQKKRTSPTECYSTVVYLFYSGVDFWFS